MIIKNVTIVNADKMIENGYLKIEGDTIAEVGVDYVGDDGIDYDGAHILPGFIDTHIHGIMGVDVCDQPKEALERLSEQLPYEGTTSFCPTTLTVGTHQLNGVIDAALKFNRKPTGATFEGIHLEGPFIDEKYKGAQNSDFIVPPLIENFENITKGHNDIVAQMTYAVEKADVSFTEYLVSIGVVASVGHSDATFKDVMEHCEHGLSKVTHLHNASSPHHHRKPGVVTAGLYSDDLYVELIADGVHVHFDVLKTVLKIKGSERIVLITDSLSAKNMPDGDYELGGQAMVKKGVELRLATGPLAGSIMPMSGCAKNMMVHANANWMDVVQMTSLNAAKLLKINDKVGVIKEGYLADLVILDDDFNVLCTYCKGEKVTRIKN